MKRSEINKILTEAEDFIKIFNFNLPPWAYYSARDWSEKHLENMEEIFCRRLGWDVTDMGSGSFNRCGLVLFTIRNG